MTPENKLTAAVFRRLLVCKQAGWPIYFWKLHGSPMQMSGMPDIGIVFRGRAVFVELKAPGKRPTKIQRHRMTELEKAGAICFVCSDLNTFIDFMETLDDKLPHTTHL